MAYKINDETLIKELCDKVNSYVMKKEESLKGEYGKSKKIYPDKFQHPLDSEIIGASGEISKLNFTEKGEIPYSDADKLDTLWRKLLEKSIICLRYFDSREPFLISPNKSIAAYGMDKLEDYHQRYTDFESLMYGASAYYRDHVFHVFRVWMLGVFCMIVPTKAPPDSQPFIDRIELDGGAKLPGEINFFERISMWTIIALCHDLGYPLEKSEQILDKTKRMMKEFIPSPAIWNNFSFSGTQDNINEYILKFISTKMKIKPPENCPSSEPTDKEPADTASTENKQTHETEYFGRIQPKYYLKYAKSLEGFQHGIISAVIIYKTLLYFLESDFNLNDDYIYKQEDARQFYIRREILRAISAHTCPDAYNIHVTTFPSLLFLCDELQEWGRKSWNELYTGLQGSSVTLEIMKFSPDAIELSETIDMKNISYNDTAVITQNIYRVFDRQYSLYKTTFRDGQYTAQRDFSLKKTMLFELPEDGAQKQTIVITYSLPKSGDSTFIINLESSGDDKNKFKEKIEAQANGHMYLNDLKLEI